MKKILLAGFGLAAAAGVCGLLRKNKKMGIQVVNTICVNRGLMTKQGLKEYKKKFEDKDPLQNYLLSEELGLSLDNQKTNRSNHALIIGGSGTGKTYRHIEPNILQLNSSMVITEGDDHLFKKYAPYLIEKGYNVQHFNLVDPTHSNTYNPLMNLYDENGNIDSRKVDLLVDLYMKNAKAGKESCCSDPYYDKAERTLLAGLIYYVLENDDIPVEDKCFHTILEKLQRASTENQNGKSAEETTLTKEIKEWQARMEKTGREIKCPMYYDTFLICPTKTANSIAISAEVSLQMFAIEEIDRLTRYNKYPDANIRFEDLAETPTCLFVTVPTMHQVYDLLSSVFFSQLFTTLYKLGERKLQDKWILSKTSGDTSNSEFVPFEKLEDLMEFTEACKNYGTNESAASLNIVEVEHVGKMYHLMFHGKTYRKSPDKKFLEQLIKEVPSMCTVHTDNWPSLPRYVSFYLDEFVNIGEIPNFLTILSTSRKYRMGISIYAQDFAKLRNMYPDKKYGTNLVKEYKTLLANVDSVVFMGSTLLDDEEMIQKILGKTTLVPRTRMKQNKIGATYTPAEIDLVSISEIEMLNKDNCIVMIRNVPPYIGPKMDLTMHPRYKEFENSPAKDIYDLDKLY